MTEELERGWGFPLRTQRSSTSVMHFFEGKTSLCPRKRARHSAVVSAEIVERRVPGEPGERDGLCRACDRRQAGVPIKGKKKRTAS